MAFSAKFRLPYVSVNGGTTASYTMPADDHVVDYTSVPNSDVTVNLVLAATAGRGAWVLITNSDGSASPAANINVVRAGADTVNGGSGYSLASNYISLMLVSDGISKWVRTQG